MLISDRTKTISLTGIGRTDLTHRHQAECQRAEHQCDRPLNLLSLTQRNVFLSHGSVDRSDGWTASRDFAEWIHG